MNDFDMSASDAADAQYLRHMSRNPKKAIESVTIKQDGPIKVQYRMNTAMEFQIVPLSEAYVDLFPELLAMSTTRYPSIEDVVQAVSNLEGEYSCVESTIYNEYGQPVAVNNMCDIMFYLEDGSEVRAGFITKI